MTKQLKNCVMCCNLVISDPTPFGIDSTGKPDYLCEGCYNSDKFDKIFRAGLKNIKKEKEDGRKTN